MVTDEKAVFVTSANFPEGALDANIELGILAHDQALAANVLRHFQGLVDHGLLRPLPEA